MKNALKIVLLGVLLLLNQLQAPAQSLVSSARLLQRNKLVYVDITFGKDSTGRRNNAAYPFKTFAAAKAAAQADDTVIVRPGTYPERLVLKDRVNWYFEPNTFMTVNSNTAGDMVSDGNVATVCNVYGYVSIKRQGVAANGNNTIASLYHDNSDVYIEGVSFEQACTNQNETECFKTTGKSRLRVKQIGPGVVRSHSYDFFVSYTSDPEGYFEFRGYDLIQCYQSLIEFDLLAQCSVKIIARRVLGDGNQSLYSNGSIYSPSVYLEIAEEMRISGAGQGIIGSLTDLGYLYVKCPLLIAEDDLAVSIGGEHVEFVGCDIVSGGTNKAAVDFAQGVIVFKQCRFFPTGTAKSIITTVTGGPVELYGCYATEDADTAGGITVVGTLTKITTMAVPD